LSFAWPSDVLEMTNYNPHVLSYPYSVSWADTERDLSAWLENDLQKNACETFYEILAEAKQKGRTDLLETLRRLSTSDHLYYMCTKYFQDGDVHKYFSPYPNPEQAYIFYMNALAHVRELL
ncbi:MAG: alpha-amylase, partial [bacterium]|nr:alpha-amylase [bacterium]